MHYDLAAVRGFLNQVGQSVAPPIQAVGFSATGDDVCVDLELIRHRTPLDQARVMAAARAAGAPDMAPCKLTPGAAACEVFVECGDTTYAVSLPEYTGREVASHRSAKPAIVRSMFPMFRWDRRERQSPDGQWFATLIGHDIGYRPVGAETAVRLTQDGAAAHPYFLGSDIWEASGDIWSADSHRFVGRSHDASGIEPLLVHDALRQTGREWIEFRYWSRASEALPITTLYVFDTQARTVTRMAEAGNVDAYLFFIEWSPDHEHLLSLRVSRDLKQYELFESNALSGESRLILREAYEDAPVKWPGGPQTARYLPDGRALLWRSDRDGFFQYYQYDRWGQLERQMTRGQYDVHEIVSMDEARGRLYRITLSPSGDTFLDLHSHLDRPSRLELRRTADGALVETIYALEPPAWRAGWAPPEEFEVPAADGQSSSIGLIFKPFDFDPTRRYPVIERIYGATSLQVTPRGYFGFGLTRPGSEYVNLIAYLASRGFVVATIDSPGTPGRGRAHAHAHALYGRWPGSLIADHASALKQLAASRPWMDLGRVGIAGNSWGGYAALVAGLEVPDLYRAVSVSVPQTSFMDHVSWINFMLGRVEDNPAAYRSGELAERIASWQPALQIVAGTADVNVPISNTMWWLRWLSFLNAN